MEKEKVLVLLDNGHCKSTPGKRSPDGKLREYAYAREIVKMIGEELDKLGISHWNCHPEEDFVYTSKGTCKSLDSRDLVLRTNRINEKCKEMKKKGIRTFLISVHVNAAGSGGKWLNATGWCCYTTPGQNNSDKLADCLYNAAEKELIPLGKKLRTDKSDGDRDEESSFWIIRKADCPAVLTENFFQDNEKDVEWLLSDEGKQKIVKLHIEGIQEFISKL